MTQEIDNAQEMPQAKHNKIINVTLWGGLMGLFASSPKSRIANAVKKANNEGYRAVQIIDANSGNLLLWLLRFILLVITIFIYTTADGYYLVLEKNNMMNS